MGKGLDEESLIATNEGKRNTNVEVMEDYMNTMFEILHCLLHTLDQCCPTLLYIGAHLTDGCGGAGAMWRLQ
jgi:hypothetical protein